jgi:hypothetical protein
MTRKRKSDMDRASMLMQSVTEWFEAHPDNFQRMLTITRKTGSGGGGGGGKADGNAGDRANDCGADRTTTTATASSSPNAFSLMMPAPCCSPTSSSSSPRKSSSDASLRMLDWFVTNYARRHDTSYMIVDEHTDEKRLFNVFVEYKTALDYYHKELFDPFRRSCSEDGSDETMEFMSQLRQLNFFKWAFAYKVIDYVVAHAPEIEQDMMLLRTKAGVAAEEQRKTEEENEDEDEEEEDEEEESGQQEEKTKNKKQKKQTKKKKQSAKPAAAAARENTITLSQLSNLVAAPEPNVAAVPVLCYAQFSSRREGRGCAAGNSVPQIFNGGAVPFALATTDTDDDLQVCAPRKRPWYSRGGNDDGVDGEDAIPRERLIARDMRPSSQRFRRTHFAPVISDGSANVLFSLVGGTANTGVSLVPSPQAVDAGRKYWRRLQQAPPVTT